MEQIREESVAKLSEIFQKRTIPLLNEKYDLSKTLANLQK